MIEWEYYSKRRNIMLPDFIISRDIESYEGLIDSLLKMGINPPPKGMYQSAYAIAFPPAPKVKSKPRPRTVRKPTAVAKESAPTPTKLKSTRTRTPAKKKYGGKGA